MAFERIRAGLLKRLHVNMHVIRSNRKTGDNAPPLSCKTTKKNFTASRIDLLDKEGNIVASLVYQPDDPMSCGARVWLSTTAEVVIHR